MIVFSIWSEFLVTMFRQRKNFIPKWTNPSWTFQLMAVYGLQLCANSHKYALENTIDQERPVVIAISTTHMLLKSLQCSNLYTSAFEFFAIIVVLLNIVDQVNKLRYKRDIPNLIAPSFSNVRHNYKAWDVKLQMFSIKDSISFIFYCYYNYSE